MLSIAILEDEKHVLNEYTSNIANWLKSVGVKGKIAIATDNQEDFLLAVRGGHANVCIIDINLNLQINGLNIAQIIRNENLPVEIIFSTGMVHCMPDAFKVLAFDFLIKPVTSERFTQCFIRLNQYINTRRKSFEIKVGNRLYYVSIDNIFYVEHSDSQTIIHTADKSLSTYIGLEEFISQVNDDKLKQCHRSIYVNTDYIDFIDLKEKKIVLKNGVKCEIGRKYYPEFNSRGK